MRRGYAPPEPPQCRMVATRLKSVLFASLTTDDLSRYAPIAPSEQAGLRPEAWATPIPHGNATHCPLGLRPKRQCYALSGDPFATAMLRIAAGFSRNPSGSPTGLRPYPRYARGEPSWAMLRIAGNGSSFGATRAYGPCSAPNGQPSSANRASFVGSHSSEGCPFVAT